MRAETSALDQVDVFYFFLLWSQGRGASILIYDLKFRLQLLHLGMLCFEN